MPMIIYSDVLVVIAQIKCLSSDDATTRHATEASTTTTTEIIPKYYLERKVELQGDDPLPKYQTI